MILFFFFQEYGLKRPLPSVFIDTFYDPGSAVEVMKFRENTNDLFE